MTLEDKNRYKKIKAMVLAGVATAAIVLGVIALVLRKTSFLPSSTIQPPTAPSSLPASEHDDDNDNDDHDDDDD
ncbi:hypothetical protein [Scytonema sp. PRP1]|uniref:hypothetical protein n=1 Tax=Scytonema sp. PRP1 TaxID=3120513 RepID=UPI0005ADEE9B|nr:hypothetical protein SD81_038010 [Tolypothrix campylonemoides VB511288]